MVGFGFGFGFGARGSVRGRIALGGASPDAVPSISSSRGRRAASPPKKVGLGFGFGFGFGFSFRFGFGFGLGFR